MTDEKQKWKMSNAVNNVTRVCNRITITGYKRHEKYDVNTCRFVPTIESSGVLVCHVICLVIAIRLLYHAYDVHDSKVT